MNAICNSKKLIALLSALLAVFVMMSVMTTSVLADDEAATEATTEAVTEVSTEDATAATEQETDATTTAPATTTAAPTTTTSASDAEKIEHRTRGIINLIVGCVILAAVAALAFVFRAKLPGWFKSLKSECGKIVWCPKDKLRKNSFVVVIIILILTVVIGLLDYAFSEGIILLGSLF